METRTLFETASSVYEQRIEDNKEYFTCNEGDSSKIGDI